MMVILIELIITLHALSFAPADPPLVSPGTAAGPAFRADRDQGGEIGAGAGAPRPAAAASRSPARKEQPSGAF